MVTRTEAFPSKYFKAVDLPPAGKALQIAKLQVEKVGLDQSEKYLLFFRGEDKQLILNITNWDAIAAICGADSDQWTGKMIVIFPTQTTFGGKAVDCIRIRRPKLTSQAKPAPVKQPEPEDINVYGGDLGSQAEDATEDDYRV